MKDLKYITIVTEIGIPKKNTKLKFVNSGVTLFFNAQHLLIQLHPHERSFYDYLCEKMKQSDNSVKLDTTLKEDFIQNISKITSNKSNPSLKSVTKYQKRLVSLGLLILQGNKLSDLYYVNPKYVFKGTQNQRTTSLTNLIESRDKLGLPNNMLLNLYAHQ